MKYVLILAGGIGSRMGQTDVPKQFMKIDDIPIIMYTLKQFIFLSDINKIIVVIPEDWKEYLDNLLKKQNYRNVMTVIGGKTRYESVLNGCLFIHEKMSNNSDTVIISHDAVRPFVSKDIINNHIELIKYYNTIDTIIPVIDTVVKIDGGIVKKILTQDNLFMSQTPQSFLLNEYLDLCSSLNDSEKEKLTDVCKIYYLNQKKIGYVMGEASNFKITTPFDLEIAKSLVKKKKF